MSFQTSYCFIAPFYVVPNPERCLAEAARALKPGGRILIFDKFLHPGERAWLRRSLSFIVAKLVTRLIELLKKE